MGRRQRARLARLTEADTPMKTEGGVKFPAAAYAYVPDKTSPSTWKIRLWESPELKETPKQVGAAMAALSPGGFRGRKAQIPADALPAVKTKVRAAWKKAHPGAAVSMMPSSMQEAIDGQMTFSEITEEVEDAIEELLGIDDVTSDVWVCDISADTAIYEVSGADEEELEGYWKVGYTIDDQGEATLVGDPVPVEQTYVPTAEPATEAAGTEDVDVLPGRLLEARGTDGKGNRVFGVQIIEHGTSKNMRRYPAAVLSAGAHLYEGAKAFDHHRTDEELRTSTISGLVGQYRNVKVNDAGLEAELHLLPSATHTAEAFDASLAAQSEGLPPLCGISHDVMAHYRPVSEGGNRLQEATKIVRVLSADVVADPAAGGRPTRMVAGGTGGLTTKEHTMNLKQLLALLRTADSAKRGELLKEHAAILTAAGLDEADVSAMLVEPAAPETKPETKPEPAPETKPELALVGAESGIGKLLIEQAVRDQGLAAHPRAVESVRSLLGETFTETDLKRAAEAVQGILKTEDTDNMNPKVPHLTVTKEQRDRMIEGMDKFFEGDFSVFSSFKRMVQAFTGIGTNALDSGDTNREMLRECIGDLYDSGRRSREALERGSESASSTTFALTLGDSVTRRLIADYQIPSLQDWRQIVSSVVPVNDFRTQRIDRVGGYGTLPTVAEGAPYQPLTTPSEEEVTYSISKKGGTEDLTLEMIANDDVRLISRIPGLLGRAAARTLHDAIWGILSANANIYDSTALFAAGHSNTTAVALSYTNYVALRTKMRRQAGFGDTANILSLVPRFLIVPPDLEGTATEMLGPWAQPATSPGATNVPNLAQGTQLIVKDFLSDTNDWFLVGDPNMVPTIEVGFYQGRQDPELFTQTDPTVGAVFNADKITWKIRHIWSFAVLDFRGFQRATQ